MWLIAAARMRIIVGIEKWTSPTSTPSGSNRSFTGQRTKELPRTSIQAYVRTMAPVKKGASVKTSRSERTGGGGGRGGGRPEGRLADAARVEGPEPLAGLDDDGPDVGHVGGRGDQVGGEGRREVDPVLDDHLLHQPLAEPLHGAALDLALDRLRIDGAPDVVGRGGLHDTYMPPLRVPPPARRRPGSGPRPMAD